VAPRFAVAVDAEIGPVPAIGAAPLVVAPLGGTAVVAVTVVASPVEFATAPVPNDNAPTPTNDSAATTAATIIALRPVDIPAGSSGSSIGNVRGATARGLTATRVPTSAS
jgi:hypothetical protein